MTAKAWQTPSQEDLRVAASALRDGQLVALPTETVYGLAADASMEAAVGAIYSLKGRPADHPLIVHVSSVARARQWGRFNSVANQLAEAFWPGPLTLICPLQEGMPAYACAGHNTIGLRVPSHPVAQSLLQAFERLGGSGLAAPSANRFGRISPTRASHVRDDFGATAPLIVDGGNAQVGLESTIVDVTTDRVRILRPGAIEAVDIARVLGLALSDVEVPIIAQTAKSATDESTTPAAPGTLAAHYAPNTPLTLLPCDKIEAYTKKKMTQSQRFAVYSVVQPSVMRSIAGNSLNQATMTWHQMPASASVLAHQLYDDLRYLDTLRLDELIVEMPPQEAGFAAIVDRLTRAQTGSRQTDSQSN